MSVSTRQAKRVADTKSERTMTGLRRLIFPKRPDFGSVKIRRGRNQNGEWRKIVHVQP